MNLFDRLVKKGELPEVRTVIEFDTKSTIELAVIAVITAVIIIMANLTLKNLK